MWFKAVIIVKFKDNRTSVYVTNNPRRPLTVKVLWVVYMHCDRQNFQPLEVVTRYRDPQPKVIENYETIFCSRGKTNDWDSKHNTLKRCCFDVGQALRRWANVKTTLFPSSVWWETTALARGLSIHTLSIYMKLPEVLEHLHRIRNKSIITLKYHDNSGMFSLETFCLFTATSTLY